MQHRLGLGTGQKGGQLTGSNPTDRGKRGTKYHLLVDRHGTPLNVMVSGANRHDSMLLEPLVDTMPATKVGGRGHPRRRPVKLHGDKGYDNRRVAERTIGWLLAYRRLTLRYDCTEKTITALAHLVVILIAARHLAGN